MNIITSTTVAAYLAAAGFAGTFALDLVHDYSDMNTSIVKSIRAGDLDMSGAHVQIAKACASSAVFLASQGHTGVSCDAASGAVKF